MPAQRHLRRGLTAVVAVAALSSAFVLAAPAGATETPAQAGRAVPAAPAVTTTVPVLRGSAGGQRSGSVSKAGIAAKPDRRDLMPGYVFRSRDRLTIDAVAALAMVMRQENIDDPQYKAARRLVSDEIARRMNLDAAKLDKKWSRAPRNHQIAGLAAITQLGVRYVEGKEDPYVQMDCSGLQWYAWRVAGLNMPRVAVSQQDRHMRIDREDAVWGDIVGDGTHVHMYLGLDLAMIHAPFNGKRVKLKMMSQAQADRAVWADPSLIAIYRL